MCSHLSIEVYVHSTNEWMTMFESMFVCIVYVDFFNVSFIRTVKHFAAVLLKWVILLHLLS